VTHRKYQLLYLVTFLGAVNLCSAGTLSKIIPRSQSMNAARQLVGWDDQFWGINRLPQDKTYTSFNLTFAYTRTFKDNYISYAFFGEDVICVCNPTDLKIGVQGFGISGSAVPNRLSTDWLADNFGLPRDFQSFISLIPRIDNFLLDFSFYLGLDGLANGLYFRIHGPYVYTKWNLNAVETIVSSNYSLPGSVGYFQGYFSSAEVPVENLNRGFLQYANGGTPIINNNYDAYGESYCGTYGPCSSLGNITWDPLCCSKILNNCDCEPISLNGFGELRFVLGYNFLNNRDGNYHLGAGIYAAAPTGSRIGEGFTGNYLFEPIIGNGKHWELGAQVTAHHIWWKSEDEENSFGIFLEANVTHLFSACQTRCFDLCSAGSNSRYMIAQRLASSSMSYPMLGTNVDSAGLAFANEYAPVANLTRRTVTSSIAVQGDVAFALAYQVSDFRWDLGYNFWGRSCEKLCIPKAPRSSTSSTWVLKGDERVYGFVNNSPVQSLAIPLAVSDSQADIHAGSNEKHSIDYTQLEPIANNFFADNIVLAGSNITTLPENNIQIYTSNQPVIIQQSDFDINGTRGYSHKLFTHFNWAWTEHEGRTWVPYLGAGAEVEFGIGEGKCCKIDCTAPSCNSGVCSGSANVCPSNGQCCVDFAPTQWGIWFKIGASYN